MRLQAFAALALAACASAANDAPAPAPKPTPAASACGGPERVAYGSTCCDVLGRGEPKSPGMVYLSCTGPRIGSPCTSKKDCDIACSCDPPDAVLGGGTPQQGPPDGTRGATGVCGGTLRVGTWMCQIDERGVVSHVIVD